MSTARAILIGHIVVNGPVLVVLAIGALVGRSSFNSLGAGLLGGALVAWLWWSLAVPRWRKWALARGADPAELQRIGAMTGLVWPKGWLPEKTEIPPRDRH
jgi:hypothetical protein